MKTTPELREKQVEQLSFYIGNPKCLDTSEPATGKTPPCCVYAYFVWSRFQKKTFWTMPKSLLKKNMKELVRFTDFVESDIAILRSDHAPLTKDWTGPVLTRFRKVPSWNITIVKTGEVTTTYDKRKQVPGIKFIYRTVIHGDEGPSYEWRFLGHGKPVRNGPTPMGAVEVEPKRGPNGEPLKGLLQIPEQSKDLIKAAALAGAKVVLCTFKFGALHHERMIEAFPDFDLLLVDELHMPGGYSTPESSATESFYWFNKHCSRFVGMTGTLINGRLDSAFPAIHVIEPNYYGSLQGFMYKHAAIVDDYDRVVLWQEEEHLKQIINRHSIRRTFEEIYGKEDVAFFSEFVDVSEVVRPSYDRFHDEAMLELDNGNVLDGTLPGVALIRARQILAHPETMGLNGDAKWTPKDERLMVHLAEGKKCLIFAALQPEQERILRMCQELGLRAEMINGNVSDRNRDRINDLAEAGQLDVIVASGPTVAVGYNWECFDHVIFASIDYMDVNILQAYRRADRGTRTTTLRVTFLQYSDSIDQRQYQIVKAKSQLANRVDPTRKILDFEEAS